MLDSANVIFFINTKNSIPLCINTDIDTTHPGTGGLSIALSELSHLSNFYPEFHRNRYKMDPKVNRIPIKPELLKHNHSSLYLTLKKKKIYGYM